MLLIVLSICLCIFAVAVLVADDGGNRCVEAGQFEARRTGSGVAAGGPMRTGSPISEESSRN